MASAIDEQDETLRKQFEQLQAQQQRRMQLLQKRKEEKAKQMSDTESVKSRQSTLSPAYGVGDNLDLKLPDTDDAHNSKAKTEQLNEQIRELKDETGRLYKLLGERDIEVRQLRKKLDDDRAVQSAGVVGDAPAATKIVELSKRVRELTAELEAERTKSKQLTRKCQELEKQWSQPPGASGTDSIMQNEVKSDSVDEVKGLQEKLKQSELKATEYRNQTQTLKAEIKVLQKVLSQEVGEGVQLQSLLNSSSGWRGRAQQIISLQKKVNELRKQLEQVKQDVDADVLSDITDRDDVSLTFRVSRNPDDKQKEKIRQIERQRKATQEKTAADMKALEQENELLKQKVEATKARITILTTENKTHKQQLQTLIDKGKHDDELIEALFKQQSQLKQAMEESVKKVQERAEEVQQAKQTLTVKQQQDTNFVEQLKAIIVEKESKIKKLELELRDLQMSTDQNRWYGETHDDAGHPSYRNRSPSDNIRSDVAARIIEEALSPTPHHNSTSRPVSSRTNVDINPLSSNGHISQRYSARDSPSDLQLKYHELTSLHKATSVERDRLTELVQVLEKRNQESTCKVADSLSELQAQRRRNALLEKQLGKVKLEVAQSAKKTKQKSAVDDDCLTANFDELKTNLDIQKDENEALKAALQSTLRAKEDDLKMYMDMIEETKKVFLQGIQQVRKNVSQA